MTKVIHIEPVEWAVRRVEEKYGDDPTAVCLIQKSGPTSVFGSLLHGEVDRQDLLEVHYFLYDLGYREFTMVRHGEVHKQRIRCRPKEITKKNTPTTTPNQNRRKTGQIEMQLDV